jgi:hypothetical protein
VEPDWSGVLRAEAARYAQVALENIGREFPAGVIHEMRSPGDFPSRPRERMPVFFGSYDWHSCVEMHWAAVRLLRRYGDSLPAASIRAALDGQFTVEGLRAEALFISGAQGQWERPYGWGWALALVHETSTWDDPDARRWAAAMEPLGSALTDCFLRWLPKETYPVRYGGHSNSAFGLSLALPYARGRASLGDAALLDALTSAASRWFLDDADYPGGWEPSGHDFLSPALTEAELMSGLLPAREFVGWLGRFLPSLASGQPASLFTPALVSDSSDGQIAHLHGLNLSRAWCWRRLAACLPDDDDRRGPILEAVQRHADAALPHVVGDDYMVSHWLVAYAVLLLSSTADMSQSPAR